jgi:cobalt-zinc-cadmium efflux system outer membrane protein
MFRRLLVVLLILCLTSGCLWQVRENTDREVALQGAHPFDVGSEEPAVPGKSTRPADVGPNKPSPGKSADRSFTPTDVDTTAFLQPAEGAPRPTPPPGRLDLNIPSVLPGSEAPRIRLPQEEAARDAEKRRIYPPLPPLPEEPVALPGPEGMPYTLTALQRLAAENSPTLRQAASDVEAAKGNVIGARAYPNPTFAFEQDPNNASSSPGGFGFYIDQVIKTAGKLRLASASALMDLANAELALKRARSDLATNVRNAYYGLVVAKETLRVNRALAQFTDEIYRLQAEQLGLLAAAYEPAALRAQAYSARLAYRQSIATYVYDWKQLVATVGLRQLPLSEVAGRVDRLIPAYDYDMALVHVLRNHTDVLTARNGIEKARYNLQLAQVTPIPDVDVHVEVAKESTLPPFAWYTGVQVGVPVPIWNQNKGPIIAAQAALVRALEEPHRVETNLTNNFATAFVNYKNNIEGVDYYRRYILPDQVRAYRGVYERRQVDPNSAFGDLVQAQQTLAADVATYLNLLGQLWTSVVTVADFLQTDDLFQQAHPQELPRLPDFSVLPPWPCPHPEPGASSCAVPALTNAAHPVANAPGTPAEPAALRMPNVLPSLSAPSVAPAPIRAVPTGMDALLMAPPPAVPSPGGR